MSFRSEEQWEPIAWCDDCGCTLYGMGERVRWASEYCPYSENGHHVETELEIEEEG